jgi:hypothetical protein
VRTIGLLILVLGVNTTFGQTASDLSARYGKSDSGYIVSKHIEMTADYSADGQVCRMRFSPRNIERQTNNLNAQLPFPELKNALNEVVPPHLRGLKNPSFGSTSLGGGSALTTYGYEKVTFTFSFSYPLNVDGLKHAESFVLPIDESRAPPPEKTPTLDDFAGSQLTRTEIVTISWNHRPCTPK